MFDVVSVLWALAAVVLASVAVRWCLNPVHAVPTVGSSSLPVLSYFAGLRFMQNGRSLLQEGYKKYYGSVFKVALADQWLFVVSGPSLIEEIRSWRDDELSLPEVFAQSFQLDWVIGTRATREDYHVDLIRNQLTQNIKVILPDLIDELFLAAPEHVPAKDSGWTRIQALTAMQEIVARMSSRIFVGLPACRNRGYLDRAISFTIGILHDDKLFRKYPQTFKPIAALLFSDARRTVRKSVPILKPFIDERKAMMAKWGDAWQDKPNDLLQWILDVAVPAGETHHDIAGRLMIINLASIHTTSTTITIALFLLAQNPEFIEPLRTEIESLIEEDGWTRASFAKMWRVDSFLKEILRHWGISTASLTRKALKDIRLRDGTVIPRGTLVVVATEATHNDGAVYDNADQFDPFRFARMREADGEATKHQFVHTSATYMPFGHGRHACPGRFFVANEVKCLLSYLLLNYDFKLSDDGPWAPSYYGFDIVPPLGGLLFRKRETSVGRER
ncbi:cytochrome P450 [Cubamyces sp. BRFM 1775]|nr:cytochrome P450 [Cubamyces sp. BRFM 1775]